MTERALYVAIGLGLAAAAADRRPNPLLNVLALAGGSYLAWRGVKGQCPVKAALMGPDSGTDRIAHVACGNGRRKTQAGVRCRRL